MPADPRVTTPAPCASARLSVAVVLALLPGLAAATLPAWRPTAPGGVKPPATHTGDYELAWRVFMGAGKLDDAIALARKALAADPGSVLWHRRLASAAEQDNQAAVAARAYAWLATRGGQPGMLDHAIALAIGTQQVDLAIALMEQRVQGGPFDAAHWQNLTAAMLDAGQVDAALALLRKADRTRPRRFFLEQEALVLAAAGRSDAHAQVLRNILSRYGYDPQTSLQLATIEYVHGHMHEALDLLKRARPRAKPSDTAYWRTLGALAWTRQDFGTAVDASRILVASGQAQAADYQRLYLMHLEPDPGVAWAYAWIGWLDTRAPQLFFDALGAANRLHGPALAQLAFDSIRPGDRHTLESYGDYWRQWARLAYQQGDYATARTRFAQALKRSPDDARLLADYVWLLVDMRDIQSLDMLTARLGAYLPDGSQLREALVAALSMTGRPTRALHMMQRDRSTRVDDADWLMQYADLLDQTRRPEAAFAVRKAAAARLADAPSARRDTGPAERPAAGRDDIASLARSLAPGDPARRAIARLARRGSLTVRDKEQVLAWTLDRDNPESAELWTHRAYAATQPPASSRLALALARGDDATVARLLADDRIELPRADRSNAADTLHQRPVAVTEAYRGLQDEPHDAGLERQFQDTSAASGDWVQPGVALMRQSGLTSVGVQARAHARIDPSLSVDVDLARHRLLRNDAAQLGVPPAHDDLGTLTLTQEFTRGRRGLIVGGGRGIDAHTRLGAFGHFEIDRALAVDLTADYGARPDDTVALMLGGLADSLGAAADYRWDARNDINASLSASRLRAQGGGRLGTRQRLDVGFQHHVWLSWPQVTVFATATRANYRRADTLPARLQRLVPAGQAATTAFFVPRSFAQACVGAQYGQQAADTWSPRLTWFASAGACSNSVSGPGAVADAGLATPLLGPDRIGVSLDFTNNTGASGNRSLSAGLYYRYYFKP